MNIDDVIRSIKAHDELRKFLVAQTLSEKPNSLPAEDTAEPYYTTPDVTIRNKIEVEDKDEADDIFLMYMVGNSIKYHARNIHGDETLTRNNDAYAKEKDKLPVLK